MREVQEPTVNDRGDESHPAFVRISAGRVSHGGGLGGAVLFDSDVVHQHTVRIVIEEATRHRDLHHDSIFGSKQIIEVELSESQWASFVSSMNSTGTPATLRWTREDGPVPELPYAPRMAMQMAEVKSAAAEAFSKAQAAMAAYEEAIEQKLGAKVIKERRHALHHTLKNAPGNVAFAAKSLSEYTEDVVNRAKADIEAMVMSKAEQLGLDPAQAKGVLELPVSTAAEVES